MAKRESGSDVYTRRLEGELTKARRQAKDLDTSLENTQAKLDASEDARARTSADLATLKAEVEALTENLDALRQSEKDIERASIKAHKELREARVELGNVRTLHKNTKADLAKVKDLRQADNDKFESTLAEVRKTYTKDCERKVENVRSHTVKVKDNEIHALRKRLNAETDIAYETIPWGNLGLTTAILSFVAVSLAAGVGIGFGIWELGWSITGLL